MRVPSVMPRNDGIFCVKMLTAICSAITVSESAHEQHFRVAVGVHVFMDIDGKDDELLPEGNVIARENDQEEHEAPVGDDG